MSYKHSIKGFAFGVVATGLILGSVPAFANPIQKTVTAITKEINLYVDGQKIKLTDTNGAAVTPLLYNNTTYLPVRTISEALDKDVKWNEKTNRIDIKQKNRYEVAGIDNPKAFEDFYQGLQLSVAKGDAKSVADHVTYPISATIQGKKITIATKQQFIDSYQQIMIDKVKQALLNQKVEDTFVNYKGVMVGNGQIWMNVSTSDPHQFFIIGINN
jgi:hypothetical protein